MKSKFKFLVPLAALGLLAALMAAVPVFAQSTSASLGQNYVSNAGTADNTVTITVVDTGRNTNTGAPDTIAAANVLITNLTTGLTINRALTETGDNTNTFTGTFTVVAVGGGSGTGGDPDPAAGEIRGDDGESIRVRYKTSTGLEITALTPNGSQVVVVDSIAPTIENTGPAHNTASRETQQIFSAEVLDARSGMGADATAVRANVTFMVDGNPVAVASAIDLGGGRWRVSTVLNLVPGTYNWHVVANDGVGNSARTDSDPVTAGNQDFVLIIDQTRPELATAAPLKAKTGQVAKTDVTPIVIDPTVRRANSVRVGFTDQLNPDSVQPSDFRVLLAGVDQVITGAVVYPDLSQHVFLTLATDLPTDSKPTVRLVGEVTDRAGNLGITAEVQADDGIPPKLTMTITGTASSRPVTNDKITVRVASDETSVNPSSPSLFVQKVLDKVGTVNELDAAKGPSKFTTITPNREWEWEYTFTDPERGLYNAWIEVSDVATNSARAGLRTAGTPDTVDIASTSARLFEADKDVRTPTVIPAATQNPNAVITFDFTAEGKEYGLAAQVTCTAPATPAPSCTGTETRSPFSNAPSTVVTSHDTHKTVTLVSAMMGTTNIASQLTQVDGADGTKFFFKLNNAAIGDHKFDIEVRDIAGNVKKFTGLTVKVEARQPVNVQLFPGQNFLSLPGRPVNPDINAVFPANNPVTAVMAFDPTVPSNWRVAVRECNATCGSFSGNLTTIDGRRGYVVLTSTSQPISVLVEPFTGGAVGAGDLPTPPPTINLFRGWNLVPVLNVSGTAATTVAPATYFAGALEQIRRVYDFDPIAGTFKSIDKNSTGAPGDVLTFGKAYWVFVDAPATLVP